MFIVIRISFINLLSRGNKIEMRVSVCASCIVCMIFLKILFVVKLLFRVKDEGGDFDCKKRYNGSILFFNCGGLYRCIYLLEFI